MRTVVLHGRLQEKFGGPFPLDVTSASEGVRALCCMVRGFTQELRVGQYRVVRVSDVTNIDLPLEALTMELGRASEVHVVPVPSGAKSRGVGKILLGVAIAALAVGFAPAGKGLFGKALGKSALGGALGGSVTFGHFATLGAALILGGVAQMLSPTPGVADYATHDRAEQQQSFLFTGAFNSSAQGLPVPLVFGRFRVGSVVASSGLSTEQIEELTP